MPSRRQEAKSPMRQICQLIDTPDKVEQICDGNKENEVNLEKSGQKSKRQGARRKAKKGLFKRQNVGLAGGNATSQESSPFFAYKTTNTSFRMRKQRKLKLQQDEDEKHKKRIEELIAYFKELDEQKLEVI